MPTIANGKITIGKLYYFKNKAFPNFALNVWCNSTYPAKALSNVCLWKFNSKDQAQMWAVTGGTSAIKFVPMCNRDFRLDRYTGKGAGAGINAHLYTDSDTATFTIMNGIRPDTVKIRAVDGGKFLTAYSGVNGQKDGKTDSSPGNVYFANITNDMNQEWIPVPVSSGDETPQKLVGPYVYSGITNDYQSAASTASCSCYPYSFHYGTDFGGRKDTNGTKDTTIKASGRGVVRSIRNEDYEQKPLGQTMVVKYDNVLNKNGVNIGDVYLRYCHLASIAVGEGAIVSAETELGERGHSGTGCPNNQPHLHLEATTNSTANADNSPSEKGGSTDSGKFDIRDVLYTKTSTTGIGKRESMIDCNSPFNSTVKYCDHGNAWYSFDSFPSYD